MCCVHVADFDLLLELEYGVLVLVVQRRVLLLRAPQILELHAALARQLSVDLLGVLAHFLVQRDELRLHLRVLLVVGLAEVQRPLAMLLHAVHVHEQRIDVAVQLLLVRLQVPSPQHTRLRGTLDDDDDRVLREVQIMRQGFAQRRVLGRRVRVGLQRLASNALVLEVGGLEVALHPGVLVRGVGIVPEELEDPVAALLAALASTSRVDIGRVGPRAPALLGLGRVLQREHRIVHVRVAGLRRRPRARGCLTKHIHRPASKRQTPLVSMSRKAGGGRGEFHIPVTASTGSTKGTSKCASARRRGRIGRPSHTRGIHTGGSKR